MRNKNVVTTSSLSPRRNLNDNSNNNNNRRKFVEINGNNMNNNNINKNIKLIDDDKFEVPLPFGYHMDLDFLRMCDGKIIDGQTLDRLKDLRKARRKQRKTLEALMGIRHEQERNKSNNNSRKYITTNVKRVNLDQKRPNPPDLVQTPKFLRDALKDAVSQFEQTLEGSQVEFTATSTPKNASKFNTFPRRDDEATATSVDASNSSLNSDAVFLSSLPSSVLERRNEDDGDSIASISSDMSTHTLKNIREQMAKSLAKLKEYEKQVEAIPVLQVKLSVMKEEKRLLMLQLKQKEMQLSKRDSGGEIQQTTTMEQEYYETEDETDGEMVGHGKLPFILRARSESPYFRTQTPPFAAGNKFQPRSVSSCGYTSDSGLAPKMVKSANFENLSNYENVVEKRDASTLTDNDRKRSKSPSPPKIYKREKGCNTEAPRKANHGTNTDKKRTLARAVGTALGMNEFITKDEMEAKIQEAVFKTEEEIMSCPLLQKAMAKVEEEALRGPKEEAEEERVRPETREFECQVGDEHLRPFVISVGLQCKLDDVVEKQLIIGDSVRNINDDTEKLLRSIGVGECKIIEEPEGPKNYKEVGVCTEKWVEVIKASKQTDTEDFAFKDTESPRVADLFGSFEPSPERVIVERRSSLRRISASSTPSLSRKSSMQTTSSPSPSRKSSSMGTGVNNKPSLRTQGTMTITKKEPAKPATRTVGTSAMMLTLPSPTSEFSKYPVGSPLSSPEKERGKVRLCDKCDADIQKAAERVFVAPPSPDQPWVSKIPRPSADPVNKLKNANSFGNLSTVSGEFLNKSPVHMVRSKSTLSKRDVGTPPPHPQTPPLRRISSPHYAGEKRSLIPKLSPSPQRKKAASSNKSSIPRVVTPPALRKMYPPNADKLSTPDRNVVRKSTLDKTKVGVALEEMKAEAAQMVKESKIEYKPAAAVKKDEKKSLIPGAALFTPIDADRKKIEPSKEMKAALKVLNDSFGKVSRGNAQVTNAINIIQQEWFKVSSTKASNPLDVEDYLDAIELLSKDLLAQVVNLTDVNGNSALHYSVSHGNFDVVSILLDSKVANPNIMNKAGYTCIMLISLASLATDIHRSVVERLFSTGDVNVRATQHGQTALMLAVSHGRLDMVELLVEAGAEVNIRDEDGSTALMCAAEHGHMEIVKYLLAQPDINVLAKDNDGLTALAVAMEAGHRDVGVVLYANMSFSRGSSPYSSVRVKKSSSSRTSTPTGSIRSPTPPMRTRRTSSNQ